MDAGFGTIWEAVSDRLGGQAAVTDGDRVLSYADLEQQAAALAASLSEAGVGAGSTVACYLHNCAEYLVAVFAAFKLGAAPVNVNYRYQGCELAELLEDAGAQALVFDTVLRGHVAQAVEQVTSLRLLVEVPDGSGAGSAGADIGSLRPTVLELSAPAGAGLPRQARPGSDRLFMYTGGTTGRPKGVVWQQGDLLAALAIQVYGPLGRPAPESFAEAVETAVWARGAGRSPVTMPVVPLIHGTGLFNTLGALTAGGHVVLTGSRRLDPGQIWTLVARHAVSNLLVAGNAVLRPMLEALEAAEVAGTPYDIRSLRTMISSGTTLGDDLKRALHERGDVTIYDGLAASEGGPFAFAVTSSPADLPSRLRPTPGTRVLDADDRDVVPDGRHVGVLAYGGRLPLGYHNAPEKTAQVYRVIDGHRYVVPGDYATLDADGVLHFLGRGNGVVNSGGEKVYPAEVEELLMAHELVDDAIVVGEPHEVWGEQVCALVAPVPGRADELDVDEVLDWMKQRMAGYKVPRRLVVLDSLERTPTGKIEFSWARAMLARHPSTVTSGGR